MKLARWQANIMLLLTAMIWGTTYTFIKQAYEGHMTAGMMKLPFNPNEARVNAIAGKPV